MYDFSNSKIRCSALSLLMAGGSSKTSMQVYLDACEEIVRKQERLSAMKKKDGPNGLKLIEDISKLEAVIPILESQKDADEPLSSGAKSFLNIMYGLFKYGKNGVFKDRGSKHTQKGKEAEMDSINLVSVLEGKLFEKHEGRLENDFICGHPDVLDYDENGVVVRVIDVKTPWDCDTFFPLLGKKLPDQYYWQMQGYLWLTDCKIGEVHFCLVNHPQHFIKKERDRLLSSMEVISELSPEFVEAEKRLINNMTFDDIPHAERRIVFPVERDDEDLKKIEKKVEKARLYLQELQKKHLGMENLVDLM